jgi:hypothetical protein
MAPVTIPLSRRYEVPGKVPFDSVMLREPIYDDIYPSGLGPPMEVQPGPQGSRIVVAYPVTIDAYLQRLAQTPDYDALRSLNAVDAQRLERAICGFFIEAATSTSPQTSSSSSSDGTQPASP